MFLEDWRDSDVEMFGNKYMDMVSHVQRRDSGYTGQMVLKMELPG